MVWSAATVDRSIESPRYAKLVTLLRQLREESQISQQELADRIGEPQSFVSKYEGGVRRIDLVELEQVADALGLTLLQIVEAYEAAQ